LLQQIPALERVQKFVDHTGCEVMDFTTKIENALEADFEMMYDENQHDGGEMLKFTQDKLLKLVNKAVIAQDPQGCDQSILHDHQDGSFHMRVNGVWEQLFSESGVVETINAMKEAYLDQYERHMIRTIEGSTNYRIKQEMREHLEEYYRFIGSFNLTPSIQGSTDGMILGTLGNHRGYDLEEKYMNIYRLTTKTIKASDAQRVKRTFKDVIKNACKKNINELNMRIIDMLQMDEQFKATILDKFIQVNKD
jgi:hypothetical protein